jgi:hypothetical protein
MGYKIAILPALLFLAGVEAVDSVLGRLKSTRIVPPGHGGIAQLFRRFDADRWEALRTRFLAPEPGEGAA